MSDTAKAFKALHQPGKPLVLANVYDVASAKVVAPLATCKAMATASAGIAFVDGVEDDDLQLDTNLAAVERIAKIAKQHGRPLTADIQDGYGDRLAEAVQRLVDMGVSGINLEDCVKETHAMYSLREAASRVKIALEAATARGVADFVVNARCDALLRGGSLDEVIERGKAYLAAGATCVFVWGGRPRGTSREEVEKLSAAFNGRLSVIYLINGDGLSVKELAEIGICRMSVGPGLYRIATAAVTEAAERLLSQSIV